MMSESRARRLEFIRSIEREERSRVLAQATKTAEASRMLAEDKAGSYSEALASFRRTGEEMGFEAWLRERQGLDARLRDKLTAERTARGAERVRAVSMKALIDARIREEQMKHLKETAIRRERQQDAKDEQKVLDEMGHRRRR